MAVADLHSEILFFSDHRQIAHDENPETIKHAVMQKSPQIRSQFFSKAFVNVRSFDAGLRFIDALIERSRHSKNAGGLWIFGDGGTGKTFILDRINQKYAPIETPVSRIVPLVSIHLRERPAISDLALLILAQLGQDPALVHYRGNSDLEDALVIALEECKTLVMLFDEAQHLWIKNSNKNDRSAGHVGEFLKRLYSKVGVAYVFAGTAGLEEVASRESQSNTRWSGKLKLKNFEFDGEFLGLLDALDEMAPMAEKAGLQSLDMAKPIHEATQGNFRLLKRLLAEAILIAANENSQRVTMDHLSRAHFFIFCDSPNPFLV